MDAAAAGIVRETAYVAEVLKQPVLRRVPIDLFTPNEALIDFQTSNPRSDYRSDGRSPFDVASTGAAAALASAAAQSPELMAAYAEAAGPIWQGLS